MQTPIDGRGKEVDFMLDNIFSLKGDIVYSKDKYHLNIGKDHYLICENGICQGVYEVLPEQYKEAECFDFSGKLIIPGLIDLHVHAPQYAFRGLGMDLELIDWLNTNVFPEEQKYMDLDYAQKAYEIFVDDLIKSPTTRACIFATLHTPATLLLMDLLEEKGFYAYVGKVNMDRNSPDTLCEESAKVSAFTTRQWIEESNQRYQKVKPILTPRFIPSCSDELMMYLSDLQRKYQLPVQSHLSENTGEIEWVRELCPKADGYADAYNRYNLFGKDCPTIMAHCVHCTEEEIQMMKKQGVYIAHCPSSNTNLSSGIAPVKQFLEQDMQVGLGSDVAAGHTLSMFQVMAQAVQASKLRWRLVDQAYAPLCLEEVFYLATKGGGSFFGRVGSFEQGYAFDALVIDDSELRQPQELTIKQRLERLLYLAQDHFIVAKYINGKKL